MRTFLRYELFHNAIVSPYRIFLMYIRSFNMFDESFCVTTNKHDMGFLMKSDADSSESNSKTLRQIHSEEDDEERFQADLQRAVRQSLGMQVIFILFFDYIYSKQSFNSSIFLILYYFSKLGSTQNMTYHKMTCYWFRKYCHIPSIPLLIYN